MGGLIYRAFCVALLLGLVFAPFCQTAKAGESDPSFVRETVQKILGQSRFQNELPFPVENQPAPREPNENFSFQPPTLPTPGPTYLAPLLKVLLWGGIAVIAIYVLFSILKRLRTPANRAERSQQKTRISAQSSTGETLSASGAKSLTRADELAANGDLEAAIRLLLALSIDLVRSQFSQVSFPSMTSREILRQAKLPAAAHTSFSTLVGAEEIVHFGGRDVNDAVFRRCRSSYLNLHAETEGRALG